MLNAWLTTRVGPPREKIKKIKKMNKKIFKNKKR